MLERTIKITCIHPERLADFRVGRDDKLQAAIGYLSQWAIGSPEYQHVQIQINLRQDVIDMELIASYHPAPDQRAGYVIGGIWHEDSHNFSFHS